MKTIKSDNKGSSIIRKTLSLCIALNLLIVSGCGGVEDTPSSKWTDSDIEGYVTADSDISLKDDYMAAINKELYASGKLQGTVLGNIARSVTERKRKLVEDTSVTGKNMEEVRKYIGLAEDWDTRNELGIAPIEPYIREIEEISSVDELYNWLPDTKRNPLGAAPVDISGAGRSVVDPSSYYVALGKESLLLGNPDNYFNLNADTLEMMVAIEEKATYILSKMNYDEAQIKGMLDDAYQFEKKLSDILRNVEEDEDDTYTRAEIAYMQADYPMTDFLDNWGYGKCDRFVMDSNYIKKIDGICQKYFEQIKSECIIYYIINSGAYLDRKTMLAFEEMSKSRGMENIDPETRTKKQIEEDRIFGTYLGESVLEGAIDEAYVDKYINEESFNRLYKMTEDIIDTYRDIFSNEPWLSDEGKKECLKKLDAIEIHVVRQSDADYSELNIVPAEDGGNFLEAYFALNQFESKKMGELSAAKVNRKEWNPYDYSMSTTITNSFYNPQTNGIYILAGIIDDPAYYEGMPYEELLGGIGMIVGHEITHGFDADGVKYDKDGVEHKWLPEDDSRAFDDRTAKVSLYYSNIKPYDGSGIYDGNMVQTEATADMGGVKACIILGSKTKGFDYDKFFRHFAGMWAAQVNVDHEHYLIDYDVHPLNYLRVNVAVSQFDEFVKTYDIQEDDGMYLAPEKRIAVW